MRFTALLAAALAVVPAVMAVGETKSAIVWFEDPSTPDSVIEQAMKDMIKDGGKITHQYKIIKGFSVTAPAKALEKVQAWGTEHAIRVEEDDMVSTFK